MHCADRNPKSMNYSDKEYAERLETTSYGAIRYAQNDGSPSTVTNLRNYGLPVYMLEMLSRTGYGR